MKSKPLNLSQKSGKREPIDISQITIDGPRLNSSSVGGSTPLNDSKVTSTPLGHRAQPGKSSKVKSIMKNCSAVTDDTMDESYLDPSSSKPKKRNKSVSFMLGDNEEVVNKKTKSDDSTDNVNDTALSKVKDFKAKRQFKKSKKDRVAEKENTIDLNQQTMETNDSVEEKSHKRLKIKTGKSKTPTNVDLISDSQSGLIENVNEKKKQKSPKKLKTPTDTVESKENSITKSVSQEVAVKIKKPKKKKHQEKPQTETETEEPVSKSRKKDPKPDVVSELENLSIGDNAHTLTNLLDEMTVVDKDKRKKLKRKNKKPKGATKTEETEKTDDVQEKVKWMRRKWNKENKADSAETTLDTTVIVENIPLSLLLSYKKVLAEHFVKYGLIRSVGIAEVYPTEVSQPVFTTTVHFYSDGAATQALEDSTELDGRRIRVKRPLPATETTLVVRSYAPLTAQCLCTMFKGAGRVRNIRHAVKGKHSMSTFFIEFDGPETVEGAMKLATNAKIGGKKVYVSKFEVRTKKTKQQKSNNNEGSDADQSEASQD